MNGKLSITFDNDGRMQDNACVPAQSTTHMYRGRTRRGPELMTDGQEREIGRIVPGDDSSFTRLASRAVSELASTRVGTHSPVSERLVVQLAKAACGPGDRAVHGAIADIIRTGVTAEEILDFYIPEAARQLGDGWCEDTLGFAEVSIGAARLQRALRGLAIAPRDGRFAVHENHSLLVAALGHDTHTLGAMTVTEQFRRRGISVRLLLGEPENKIIRTVADGQFDAVIFSIAVIENLSELGSLIGKLRRVSDARIPILVGGAACGMSADIKKATGADHSTSDVNEAIRLCGLKSSSKGAKLRATTE